MLVVVVAIKVAALPVKVAQVAEARHLALQL
jgi:hypothetical protein